MKKHFGKYTLAESPAELCDFIIIYLQDLFTFVQWKYSGIKTKAWTCEKKLLLHFKMIFI